MQIKFPPLINVEGTLAGVRTFGSQTIILEIMVKGRAATISLPRSEAEKLFDGLKSADCGGEEPQSVVSTPPSPSVPRVTLPKR